MSNSARDRPRLRRARHGRCAVDRHPLILIKTHPKGKMFTTSVHITLNGDPLDAGPVTVAALLESLEIDARKVAVEHNLVILKRTAFDQILVREGDHVEIVNFVGGG
jgi:thiamine biosynthesis protein ThiS